MEQAEARAHKQELEERIMEAVKDFNAKTDRWIDTLRMDAVCMKDSRGKIMTVEYETEINVEL